MMGSAKLLHSLTAVGWLAAAATCSAAEGPPANGPRGRAHAEAVVKQYLQEVAGSYQTMHDNERRLVYVGALDEKHFRETAGAMSAFADALQGAIFSQPAKWHVVVILPTVDDYSRLAPSKEVKGFYAPKDRTLISIDRGRVLLHEFTHALHHADADAAGQTHPIWICEGFATLFESCKIGPQGLQPQTDLRLLSLQNCIRTSGTIRLDRLVQLDHRQFTADAERCYAQARYLMLYLHQSGKLKRWYETYKATYTTDISGKRALENVLGKRLSEIQHDYEKWALDLSLPWGEVNSSQGRLGLEFQDISGKVKVVGLVSGGAAEKAGRIKVGDVITHFNGLAIRNSGELVGAIRASGAHQTVEIHILRHGRTATIHQPLAAAGR